MRVLQQPGAIGLLLGSEQIDRFENFLAASPGRVALWLGAHTHTVPDDRLGQANHTSNAAGYDLYQCRWPDQVQGALENCVPRSWLLTFSERSYEVTAQCYLTSDYASQSWVS